MKNEIAENIAIATERLEAVDALSVIDGVSNHFLQVLKAETSETVVRGNTEGLVYLALSILRLAGKQTGAHQHFDESGIVDKCDDPLVITKCDAAWED